MQQTILAWQNANDRAEIQKFQYSSVVYSAHLYLGGNIFDTFFCHLATFGVNTGYHNGAVVGDIDGGAGFFGQRTDYRAALAKIERLFEAIPDTPDGNRLDVSTTLVEAYERQQYPIAAPDSVEAIGCFGRDVSVL